jgi:hypothetical protein
MRIDMPNMALQAIPDSSASGAWLRLGTFAVCFFYQKELKGSVSQAEDMLEIPSLKA